MSERSNNGRIWPASHGEKINDLEEKLASKGYRGPYQIAGKHASETLRTAWKKHTRHSNEQRTALFPVVITCHIEGYSDASHLSANFRLYRDESEMIIVAAKYRYRDEAGCSKKRFVKINSLEGIPSALSVMRFMLPKDALASLAVKAASIKGMKQVNGEQINS